MELTSFNEAIKSYLDELAAKDELFAKSYAKPGKSIDECCKYIYQEVGKQRQKSQSCVALRDEEVFGMAVHYYDEDDIKVESAQKPVVSVSKSSDDAPKVSDKAGAKKKAKKTKKVDENLPEELVIPLF